MEGLGDFGLRIGDCGLRKRKISAIYASLAYEARQGGRSRLSGKRGRPQRRGGRGGFRGVLAIHGKLEGVELV